MDYLKLAISLAQQQAPSIEEIDVCLMDGRPIDPKYYPYCSAQCALIAELESED